MQDASVRARAQGRDPAALWTGLPPQGGQLAKMDFKGIEGHTKLSFWIMSIVAWVLFFLLAVLKLPLLQLWIFVGLAAVVAGFWLIMFT